MSIAFVSAYLNDHLSGAVAALELLDRLETAHAGAPIATLAAGLREDIAADRGVLESLMGRLGIAQAPTSKATAWLAEQAAQLKLWLDDPSGGGLRLLETFEALSLGIEGKRLMWRSLKAAAADRVEFRDLDFATLERRAVEQRAGVEAFRLGAAKGALGGATPPTTAP
ncbi:hypothetical protein TA3x_003535 [Tundrisphaera sp. TA3]|uniref:hypothetical protein n=1 Tax=Tundrisphaera sp. TA3 TaxID=3435775 RepID=UPI003EB9BEF8